MSNTIAALPPLEPFVVALIQGALALDDAHIGGSLLGDPPNGYVRVSKVWQTGTRFIADITIDVEVFDTDYLSAESRALDIEALLLGYPHVVEVDSTRVVFDETQQNAGPHEIPWEDPSTSRILSTYVLTVRR